MTVIQGSRRDYEEQGFLVLPDGYVNERAIEDNWDDILRFVATIKLKETTASQLFKRLNSYSKQHPLWQALKEWGKIGYWTKRLRRGREECWKR
jgi:TnpA family transposase